MLHTLLTVKTTEFYQTFDKVGGVLVFVLIALFALMFLYATIKYVKP
ncbi:hypothetical protein [Chitinophaga agrisoli]|nr:hypothetical protein [Chitinophaga agrisoli]